MINKHDYLVLLDAEHNFVKVKINEICYICAELKEIAYYTESSERYTQPMNLSHIENLLQPLDFERLHRNNIVNMEKIESIDEEEQEIVFNKNVKSGYSGIRGRAILNSRGFKVKTKKY